MSFKSFIVFFSKLDLCPDKCMVHVHLDVDAIRKLVCQHNIFSQLTSIV